MVIEVFERSVFGRNLLYPMNEPARALAELVRSKTLNLGQLHQASKLGLRIKLKGLALTEGLAEAIDKMNEKDKGEES